MIGALLCTTALFAQHRFKAVVKCAHHKEPLAGATVVFPVLNKMAVADSSCTVLLHKIPSSKYLVKRN